MADKFGSEDRTYNIIIPDITYEEFEAFRDWLNQQSYWGGIGYVLYPQNKERTKFILTVDHGSFGCTWWGDALPDIIERFGENRIVYSEEE